MTALHQFRGSLTAEEAGSIAIITARDIKGTPVIAILLIAGGVFTILGLIALALGSVKGALQWLVLAGLAAFSLGALGVLERRRQRKVIAQEIRGSIGPDGIAVIDRGLPILHDWSVVRSVDGSDDLLIVWLSDDVILPLSPRMFESRLDYESATAMVNSRAQQLG